jgi:hypothetical protein
MTGRSEPGGGRRVEFLGCHSGVSRGENFTGGPFSAREGGLDVPLED